MQIRAAAKRLASKHYHQLDSLALSREQKKKLSQQQGKYYG